MKRLILALLIPLFTGSMVLAAPVGTLILESGKVRIRSMHLDTTYHEVGTRVLVNSGDEIQTGVNSRAVIKLDANGDDIELYSKTFFKLTEVTSARQELSMPIGKVHFSVKKVRKYKGRKRFRIRTANAIIGVKGTKGIGETDGVSTDVACTEGTCTVSSFDRPDVVVEVQANQISRVRKARLPTRPVAVPPKVMAALKAAVTGKRVTGIRFGATVKVQPQKEQKKEEMKDGGQQEGKKSGQQPLPSGGDKDVDPTDTGEEGDFGEDGDPGVDEVLDEDPTEDPDELIEGIQGELGIVTDDIESATESSTTIRLKIVN